MTDKELPLRSRQSDYLLLLLGDLGFEVPDELPQTIDPDDGYVINRSLGIWVHADPDMIRLVVQPAGNKPEYRLVLGRRGLTRTRSLDIIAVHAGAAVAERTH